MNKLLKRFLYSLLLIINFTKQVHAAACCGGGYAAPAIISGDDAYQISGSVSYQKLNSTVDENGYWKGQGPTDSIQTFKIDAAGIFADDFQYGLSIPIQRHTQENATVPESTGLADVAGLVGYEYLPDWDYNPVRPKGIGYLTLTFPTGSSIYSDDSLAAVQSRGRGIWSIGLGTLLTKSWIKWDSQINFEIHKGLENSRTKSDHDVKLKPGYGSTFNWGLGYNKESWRIGGSVTLSYEEPLRIESTIDSENSKGQIQRYWTSGLNISYLFNNLSTITVSYSDQTLLGDPVNASLNQGISVSLLKRWAR